MLDAARPGSGTRVSHPMHKCRHTQNTQILGLRGLEIWHYIPTLIGRREHGQEINGMFSDLHFNALKNKTNKQTYLHKETSRWTSRQEITLCSFNLLIYAVLPFISACSCWYASFFQAHETSAWPHFCQGQDWCMLGRFFSIKTAAVKQPRNDLLYKTTAVCW